MKSVAGGLAWGVLATGVGLVVFSLSAPVHDPAQLAAVPTAPQPATQPPVMEEAPKPDPAPQPPIEPAPQAEVPAPETGAVEVPAGSEFNRAPAEGPVTLPGDDAPVAPDRTGSAQPDIVEIAPAPAPDTTPAAQPEVGAQAPDGMSAPVVDESDPTPSVSIEEPALPSPESAEPSMPALEAEPIAPVEEPAEPAPSNPRPGAIGLPQPGFEMDTPGVRTGRLPAIGQQVEEPKPVAPVQLGALSKNAEPFKSSSKPLMSIVLIDAGDQGLDRASLGTFSFPVTFAIDAARPDAVEAMEAYRKAGYETVLMIGGLPDGATPQDLEVSLTQYMAEFDEAVAVMDIEDGSLQTNRALLTQLMEITKESGHGVVSFDKGLNTADQLAQAADVPSGLIFRTVDAQRESAPTIQRYLNRAAFKAGQDGQVIMLGHSYADTVTALFQWALEGSTEVTLAPLSAVLKSRR